MSDADLTLVERAAARGLIPAEALDRARRECRRPAAEWLLKEKLLTKEQLRDLMEDELPLLPRSGAKDSSWAVFVFFLVIAGAVALGGMALWSIKKRERDQAFKITLSRHYSGGPIRASATPMADATAAFKAGDYPRAIAHCTEVLRTSPGDPTFLSVRASSHYNLGHHASALADAEEALRTDPAHEPSMMMRAVLLVHFDRDAEAVGVLEKLPPSPDRDGLLEAARKKAAEKK